MSKLGIFRELWLFVRTQKRWWLLPILAILILLGLIIAVAEPLGLLPFLYPVFGVL